MKNRETPTRRTRHDSLIDASLLSLQIKAGASWFSDSVGEYWRVNIKKSTVEYWKGHTSPVLLVLADLASGSVYWVRGDSDHQENETTYTILVPKKQRFDGGHWQDLRELAGLEAQLSEYLTRGRFELARPWINAIKRGEDVEVNVERLDNVAPNRKRVTICYALTSEELLAPEYLPDQADVSRRYAEDELFCEAFTSVRETVSMLFEWADAETIRDDEQYAEEYSQLESEAEDYDPPRTPEETGLVSFDEWVDKTYYNRDEDAYWRWLPKYQTQGFSFRVQLNQYGERLLEALNV